MGTRFLKEALGSSGQSFRDSIRSGFKFGVLTATLFSVGVTVQRLLLGPDAFARFGMSWSQVVIVYYGTFTLGGCAYGALLPLRPRHVWAAPMSGVLFLSPMYLGFAVVMNKIFDSLEIAILVGVMLSIFGGVVLGLFWWDEDKVQR